MSLCDLAQEAGRFCSTAAVAGWGAAHRTRQRICVESGSGGAVW